MSNSIVGEVLMYICCWGVVLCGVALFAVTVLAMGWDEISRFLSSQGIKSALLIMFAVGLVHYAATKPKITFSDGIKNAGGSFVTNDTIHIEWVRDPWHDILIPLDTPVYIDYRPHGSTNEWGMLAQSVVMNYSWDGTLADATNYDYNVWAYYIPPQPVTTNEMWNYSTILDAGQSGIVPLRSTVEVNGNPITPKKGKDEE